MNTVEMIDDTIRACFRITHEILWREFSTNERYQWYYAENRVYLICDSYTDAVWFVFASNPNAALQVVLGKIAGIAKRTKENN